MAEKQFKVASIGFGLGGSNFAQTIKNRLGGGIGFVNLSKQDLSTAVIENKEDALLLDTNGSGAGKNRAEGGRHFNTKVDDISKLIYNVCDRENADILFVCASTSGGTGSGLIPRVLAYLFTKEFEEHFTSKNKVPPVVFAVALTPDFSEGIKSLTNTIDCLDDFRRVVDKYKAGRFLLVTNEFGRNEKTTIEKYSRINEGSVGLIARYLEQYGSSREGNLDRADRLTCLRTPGIHALFSFGENGRHESPFIQPEGARVMQVGAEIPEGQNIGSLLDRWGLIVDDDIKGHFSVEDKLSPIVHLAGFNNWNKLAERFKSQLELRKSRAEETQETNNTQGIGLSDVKKQRKFVTSEYSAGVIASVDDISDLFADKDEDE